MKKQAEKDPAIKSLANEILNDAEDSDQEKIEGGNDAEVEIPTILEVEDVLEEKEDKTPKSKGKIPNDIEEEILPVSIRISLDQGTTKSTAFVVQRRIEEIYSILNHYFGKQPGDYFIGSENTLTATVNNQRKRFKCVIVEDKNHFGYTIWFDISSLGPVY